MKHDKTVWLEQLGAVAETLTALPDDVRICRLYQTLSDRLEFQIIKHPDVTGDKVVGYREHDWFETNAFPVTVGWCEDKEDEEDDDL